MTQMKDEDTTPEKKHTQLNKMEASNLPDTEFKAQVIRMLKELSENLNKEIASIKKGHRSHNKESVKNKYNSRTRDLSVRRPTLYH